MKSGTSSAAAIAWSVAEKSEIRQAATIDIRPHIPFDQVIAQLPQTSGWAFGSGRTTSGGITAIRNLSELAAAFMYHQAPVASGYPYLTHDGIYDYAKFSDADASSIYVFGADSLTMQPVCSTATDCVVTQIQSGATIPNNQACAMALLGLSDTTAVVVGQLVIRPYDQSTGSVCTVVAKDATTVTLRDLGPLADGVNLRVASSGLLFWTTGRVTRIAGTVNDGAMSFTVQSMPSGVVNGMRPCNVDSYGYVKRGGIMGGACTVSGNTVTMTERGYAVDAGSTTDNWVVFLPPFRTGNIVTQALIEPPKPGEFVAFETDWEVPANASGLCPDTQYMDTLAAYAAAGGSSIPFGSWASSWLFIDHTIGTTRPDEIGSEIDFAEMWGDINMGLKADSSAYHNQYPTANPKTLLEEHNRVTYLPFKSGNTVSASNDGGLAIVKESGTPAKRRKTQAVWTDSELVIYKDGVAKKRFHGPWHSAVWPRWIVNASLGGMLYAKYLQYPQSAAALENGRVKLYSMKMWRG